MSDIDTTTPGSTPPATFGVTTDQPDYAPGSTATFTATGATVGGSVEFAVADDPADPGDDGDADVYKRFIVTDGGEGDLDGQANGTVVAQWQVPASDDALNATLDLVVTDVSTGSTAETTFTDAAGSTNKVYQHWADAGTPEWNNNILNDAKSDYFEGDVIPHVYVYKASNQVPLVNGQSYSFTITYNYYQQNTNAGGFDYITTYNLSRTPGPNDATNPYIAPSPDGTFTNGGGTQGVFHTVDANVTTVSGVTYLGTGSKDGQVTVTFTYTGTTTTNGIAEIYFGLHVAQPGGVPNQGAGPTDGANAWSGGSLQTSVDGSSIQLAPAAIIAGEISGIKFNDVNGDGARDANGVDNILGNSDDEVGLAGWTIFVDKNNNSQLDGGEASTVTGAGGLYSFSVTPDADKSDVDNDPYIIREVNQAGWAQTTANPAAILITAADPTETNVNFGNQQQNPSLNIVKDASVPGGTANAAGELISYTITVANTGNTTLTGVAVTDPYADAGSIVRGVDVVGDNDALLEVGETWGYTAAHTVTQAEIDSNGGGDGFLENTATADSNETGPDTDDASVPVAQNAALNITKDASVPGGTANAAGELISYTITVANTGNTTLTGVAVTDPYADAGSIVRGADVVGDNDALLEVGETWSYAAAHTVLQSEIDSNGGGDGFLENIATADSDQTGPDTDDASVPVAQNAALNITKDASVPGGTANAAGEVISYAITVQNTGNATLTGVAVTDPYADAGSIVRGADVVGDNDALLEVGETWGYTAAHTVTQAEIDSNGGGDGFLENTATADSDQTGPDTDDASVPVAQNAALNITKDASVPGGTADAAGEVISYTITVQNTGNATLTGVAVTDPYADAGSIVRGADVVGDNDALLEVGETWGYTAAHTVTQAEIDSNGGGDGFLENTATADSDQTGPDTDDASVPVAQNAALNITKDASVPGGTANAAGELISYAITVANTGNATLTGVAVTDPYADAGSIVRGADVVGDNDALLEVGETWGYTAAHTVTQAEIDSNGGGDGFLENTATADSNETGPDTDDASVPVAQNAALNITKDASVLGGTANAAGELISYTITVANTGNATLTGVAVTDPYADAGSIVRGVDVVGDNDALLEVGETWSYTAAHTVTQAEIDSNGGGDGFLENTATADSNETGPDTDDASVPVVSNPSLNITKDASVPGGTANAAGELISYAITVANTGNATLTGVSVTDPYADAGSIVRGVDVVGDNDALLEVGETWAYTAAHTVTQAEIDSNGGGDGFLENTATADSNETGPDTDDASVPVAQNAALNITKDASVPGGTANAAGEVISYAITVANTGNATLTGVAVTDPYADAGSIVRGVDVVGDNDALLEVGETWSYTAAHTVTQAEIDSNGGGDGFLENIATADSNETGPDTDDASVPVASNPALNITKDASVPGGTANVAGELISYAITVQNTGNATLTGVAVTDPYADAGSIVRGADVVGDNDALLEVGETWGYTAAHTVLQSEIDSNGGGDGFLENTATADSNETGPDTDDASVPVAQNAALNITKGASVPGGTADAAGEVISYTITVQNTGNATLTGVTVTDPYADAGSIVRGADVVGDNDALLEVGETWGYTAAHTVTQAEIDSNGAGDGFLENIATADSNETGPDTDDASVPVANNPSLNIVKDASVPGGTANAAGELISYVITIANTGNATLTGVAVTDPYADAGSIVRGADVVGDNDALLEVGETWGYTAAHTVLQSEIDSNGGGDGFLENTATADSNETGPDTDDASVPVASNPALNITKDASVPGGTANAAGELISYVITVANTGNATLTGVAVTDPYADAGSIVRGVDVVGDNDGLLEVGETWSYTAAHAVTQAEIDSNGGGDGFLENTATADSNETGPDTDDASVPVASNPSLNIAKDASVPGGTANVAGELISYVITVANTGNATLTGVAVTDPYADAGSIVRGADVVGDNDALLEVGETWSYTAAHTVLQSEIDSNGGGDGFLENTATADSNETGPDTDDASVPVAQNAALNIAKDASVPGGTANAAGEVISYTITVANTGNTTLTGVTVTDPYADAGSIVRGADVVGDNDALLEVGETWGYTAAHTVLQSEIDSNGGGDGFLENTATADSNETGPDTDDASVPVASNPALNITKDASVPGGTANAAGELISYTITVQNTGNATLTEVTVTDPYADAGSIVRGVDVVGDNDALLEVGETWGYTAAHTVLQSEIDSNGGGDGFLENTATADSNETGPDTDDASVPVAQNAALNITKDASVPGGTANAAGELISYTITVQNTGNATLTGVAVTDPYADAGSIVRGADVVGDNDALLEVGETWSYAAAHTVLQSEIDSNGGGDGFLENIATADSDQTGPDTDDASVPVAQNAALNITKDASVPGGTANAAGELISYTITVANTGNATLTGVTVTDPYADAGSIVRGADLVGDNDALLEVGETWGYTAAHTVTQAEIDSNGGGDGFLENIATADSNETGPDTDDASVPVAQNAALNITKDASVPGGTANAAGELISYTITVQNTGNATLTGVAVTDPYADAGSIVRGADVVGDNDALLEVGETWGYTAAHTVTQAEIDSNGGGDGFLENTATADSNETGPDTDDASVPVARNPALNIVKDVSSVTDGPDAFPGAVVNGAGDVINYVIRVQNTGNVTLTGVAVTDPYANAGSIVRGLDVVGDNDVLLEVGETWSYTAAHTVSQAEINSNGGGDGLLENIATADSNETGPDTDDASVPLVFNPGVNIDKTAAIADGHADQAGDIINYTVKVANTGNVTLSNVQVTDAFEGAANVILTNANSFNAALHTGNTFTDPNGNGALDVGETWTYTYQHVVTQNELNTKGVDGDGSLDNVATVTTTSPDLGPLQDDASIPILLGPGVRTPGFWSQPNWQKFWDGIAGNEPGQAGTNGFADGEITKAVVNSLGNNLVDTNGDHVINGSDAAPAGKVTAGLLIGDFDLDGIEDPGEHAFFIKTSDALTLLNANQKQLQNAEYQEGRALVATWLNYLAGNPLEAGDPAKVDAKDAIQWGVDWLLKTTKQTDGSISLADMNGNAVAQSSAAWNTGIDGPDGGTAPTVYAKVPQYNPAIDIPGGVQILGVLDEYNNHGTVYGTAIATA